MSLQKQCLAYAVTLFAGWAFLLTNVYGQEVSDSLLDAMGRFHFEDASPREADRLLQAIDAAECSKDKRFLYYQAVALEAKSDKTGALKAAEAAIASGYVPTLFEAKMDAEQWRLELAPPTPGANSSENMGGRALRMLNAGIEEYPYGQEEFEKLSMLHGPAQLVLTPFLPSFGGGETPAGKAYEQMTRIGSARRIYNRMAGDQPRGRLRLVMGTDAWEGLARCYNAQGHWELAQGYMVKSAVGNGMPPAKRDFFKAMDANIRDGKKPVVVEPKPDAAMLEQIIVWLAGAQLFPDAFQAIDELKAIGKAPSTKTQIVLHEEIVKLIEAMKKGQYNNVKFRGIDINDSTLAKERQLIEELKKKSEYPMNR
jgi:hypothetical protein